MLIILQQVTGFLPDASCSCLDVFNVEVVGKARVMNVHLGGVDLDLAGYGVYGWSLCRLIHGIFIPRSLYLHQSIYMLCCVPSPNDLISHKNGDQVVIVKTTTTRRVEGYNLMDKSTFYSRYPCSIKTEI